MKIYLLFLSFFFCISVTNAQKKIIDKDACENWVTVETKAAISGDGKYVLYRFGSAKNDTVMLVATDKSYKKKIPNGFITKFTADNTNALIQTNKGTLIQINLLDKMIKTFPEVSGFSIANNSSGSFTITKKDQTLILVNSKKRKTQSFQNVKFSLFNPQGNQLLLNSSDSLVLVNVETGNSKLIFKSSNLENFVFSAGGKLAFVCKNEGNDQLWKYQAGTNAASCILEAKGISSSKAIRIGARPLTFSKDEKLLYFGVISDVGGNVAKKSNQVNEVTIRSYLDKEPVRGQGPKYAFAPNLDENCAVIGTDRINKNIRFLETPSIRLLGPGPNANEYLLVRNVINDQECYWNGQLRKVYLVSVRTGNKKLIIEGQDSSIISPKLSPHEHYVVWYNNDNVNSGVFSYNVETRVKRNILPRSRVDINLNSAAQKWYRPYGVEELIWFDHDAAFILRDRHDLWRIDPDGKQQEINLTASFGKKYNLSFFPINHDQSINDSQKDLIFSGFDLSSSDNGFWRVNLKKSEFPHKLIMGPDFYYWETGGVGIIPLKATNSPVYLVTRMNATSAQNFFVTKDFKHYNQLSFFEPQRSFNWLTSEMVHWKMPNGFEMNGILYKPENFDSTKKYPMIISYYETRSDEKNIFLKPTLTAHRINIPWFVSRGYLVFIPDLYFVKGHPDSSLTVCVLNAIRELKKNSWIDTTKIGLQGQSFGGHVTNALIANSHIFAAAQEMAGSSDLFTSYGQEFGGRQYTIEKGQGYMDCTPWERPDLYIENSPMFKIGSMVTPLLIVHNQGDHAVPYLQAVEFFTNLRRAQKKVWWLEYKDEGHFIRDPKRQLDLTIRTEQFFDHYLKGAPMPEWMSTPDYEEAKLLTDTISNRP